MFDAHGAVREHECDWEWPRRAEVLPMATLLEICAETHAWCVLYTGSHTSASAW